MITVLVFLLTICILVIFHEFGHYIVARIFKVKILEFSVGFGPKLFRFKGKNNYWSLRAIPLGGYVKMLDAREGTINESDKSLAFNYKKPYQKILIAFAGPAFNLLFAFLMYYGLSIIGVSELKPVISSINPDLAITNRIHIESGSYIHAINSIKIDSWQQANRVFSQQIRKSPIINIDLTVNNKESIVLLNLDEARKNFHKDLDLEDLGLYPFSYLPIILDVEPSSPAAKAKLQVGDQIIAINAKNMRNWFDIAKIIQNSATLSLNLQIKRQNKLLNLLIVPDSVNNDGQIIGRIGIMPILDQKLLMENLYVHQYNPLTALLNAADSCYSIIKFNFSSLYAIVTGQISAHNLGGPIAIAKAANGALASGIKTFIDFLGIISIGLAIMNLLPVPVLDGGHIFIYIVEWIIGREVTHSTQIMIFKIGFVLLIGISIFALYNDILRL